MVVKELPLSVPVVSIGNMFKLETSDCVRD